MFKNLTKKRLTVLLVSLSLVLVAGVGVTLALIIDSSGPVDNTFEPSHVSCAVVEDQKTDDTGYGQVKVETKTNVKIKNTGDTDAYIRVAVVVNWKNSDGKVWAVPPGEDDYSIDWAFDDATPTAWFEGSDGYYYYKKSVSPNYTTETLITSAEQLKDGPVGTDGTQYYLSIEIVASAIQSSPVDAVYDAWGVTAAHITG